MRIIAILVAIGTLIYGYLQAPDSAPPFDHPLPVAVERKGSGMKQFEFERLLAEDTTFEDLAVAGFYTVIEGYTDSCGICRALEKDLPSLLSARSDVVVRRVRFSERGGQRFRGSSAEEIQAQMDAYAARLKRYRSFNIVDQQSGFEIGTCGTPHVEIYKPDGSLLATDYCDRRVYKHGLSFLREWIAAERTL